MQSDSQSVTSLNAVEFGVQRLKATKDDFNCVHFIGKGTYGLSGLWIANYKPLKKYFMLRKTNLDILEYDDLENLQYEMQLSSQLLHPAILSFQCSFVQEREIWTVFPFFDFGSCSDILEAGFSKGLNEIAIVYIMRNVLQALEYLHKAGYIHRAVKASHILVSADGRVCLTGLRYCVSMWNSDNKKKAVHCFPDHAVAILPWIAPEVLDQNLIGYTEKSDIYSVGITLIELASGEIPYSELPATKIFLEKISGQVPYPLNFEVIRRRSESKIESSASTSDVESSDRNHLQPPSHSPVRNRSPQSPSRKFSSTFKQIIDSCLDRHPGQRPTASSLLGISLFKQSKKKSREFLNLSQLLHPVIPITDLSSFRPDECLDDHKLDTSIDIDKINIQESWIYE